MSKKVLVTGGAGYIGSHTVVQLEQSGYTPVILDDYSNSEHSVISRIEKILGKGVIHVEGKVQDKELLRSLFAEHKLDAVIHFAAHKAVGESVNEPLKYYKNNLQSLWVLLEIMDEFDCQKLVFSSSCTVYGQPEKLPVTETTPRQEAESPYGNTKRIGEDIIEDFTKVSKLKAISLRYFNPIGAHESALIGELPKGVPANLVPFVTQTAAGIREKLTVFGNDYNTVDGSCIRDYIHVLDLAAAHVDSLRYMDQHMTNENYDILNVGTGNGNTVLELIHTFEDATGIKVPHEIGERRAGDIEQIYADNAKIVEKLGWKAKYTLEDALKHAWEWQKTL